MTLADVLRDIDIGKCASATGIPVPRLLEIRDGADPSMHEASSIARFVGKRLDSLIRKSVSNPTRAISFRARTSAAAKEKTSLANADALQGVLDGATLLLGTASTQRPQLSPSRNRLQALEPLPADPESLAGHVRHALLGRDQLRPMPDLTVLLTEKLGVLVFVVQDFGFEGASVIGDGLCFIFASHRPNAPERMLFTIAHEVGHLVRDSASPESAQWCVQYEDAEAALSQRAGVSEEAAVNRFASALLLPAEGVRRFVEAAAAKYPRSYGALTDVHIALVSGFYSVSFGVAAYRCEQLDLLVRGGAQALIDAVKKKYGSGRALVRQVAPEVRTSIDIPPVPASVVAQALERVRRSELSIGRVRDLLGVTYKSLWEANRTDR